MSLVKDTVLTTGDGCRRRISSTEAYTADVPSLGIAAAIVQWASDTTLLTIFTACRHEIEFSWLRLSLDRGL